MKHHIYRLIIAHSGRSVEVKPTLTSDWTPELLNQGIGRMVMSEGIDAITVFKDGRPYRHVKVDAYGAPTIQAS